jgi:hypothetical protein
MASTEMRADPIRSLAFGSIVAGYTAVGVALAKPVRLLMVQNTTDAALMFSFDAANDHFMVPSGGFFLLDVCTNQFKTEGFYVSVGTTMYVKQIGIPTTGTVYATALYARGT